MLSSHHGVRRATRLALLGALFGAFVQLISPSVARADEESPSCEPDLVETFDLITQACTEEKCEPDKLKIIDKKISRPKLLAAISQLRAVRVFWPEGKHTIDDALDARRIRENLETLALLAKQDGQRTNEPADFAAAGCGYLQLPDGTGRHEVQARSQSRLRQRRLEPRALRGNLPFGNLRKGLSRK